MPEHSAHMMPEKHKAMPKGMPMTKTEKRKAKAAKKGK